MSILISNGGSIIHNNFSDDPDKTRYFLEDFNRLYPTICYFRSLDQMGDAVSYLTDSLTGVLKGSGELEQAKEESLEEKYAVNG